MNKLLLGLLLAATLTLPAHADLSSLAPFSVEQQNALNGIYGNTLPVNVKNVARIVFDCGANSNQCTAGLHTTNTYLPTNALIQNAYVWVQTAAVGFDSTSNIGIMCNNQNDIMSSAGLGMFTPANRIIAGRFTAGQSTIDGASVANYTLVASSRCNLTWVVQGTAPTAGRFIGFVEYNILQ